MSQYRSIFLYLAIFLCYQVLLVLGIRQHEPWFDEAQAWLLGRDSHLLDLINHHLRYEGSPGLWHFILGWLAKAGFPYVSMHIVAAVSALLGVGIFLRFAPFPFAIKFLFPFSYFVLY